MNRFFFLLLVVVISSSVNAQLPNRVHKLEGLWEYRQGSGFERWTQNVEIMQGESFRINKLGDTLIAERFEISYVNKRLVMDLKAYHMVRDSVRVRQKTLIGKRKRMEFTSVTGIQLETLRYRFGFFSKKRLKLYVHHQGAQDPQKLVLLRRD